MEWLIVTLASFAAGLVDAIVGGGGLILIPALFTTFPDTSPATLFGTNKSAAVWGTGMSAWQYGQRVRRRWSVLLPAFGCAMLGSLLGAWAVTQVDPSFLRRLLPLVLLAVLVNTLRRKDLGTEAQNLHTERVETLLMGIITLVSSAIFSAPSFLKIFTSLPQSGHINPLIFSTIPNNFRFSSLENFTVLLESRSETSCGVVTIIAFASGPIFCAILKVSSPVPGGRSTTKKSISPHSIPFNISEIAPIF